MKYAIRIDGGRYAGEYDGGATVAAATKRALEDFAMHVEPRASIRIVRFSADGEKVITVATIKEAHHGDRRETSGSRLLSTRMMGEIRRGVARTRTRRTARSRWAP